MKTTARPITRREQFQRAQRAPGQLLNRTTRGTFSKPARSVFTSTNYQVPRWG